MALFRRIIPPMYGFLTLILMLLLHVYWPITRLLPAPLHLAGLLPLAAGLGITVRASRRFDIVGTTVKPSGNPTMLVTDGLYRYSRNPMYLGGVLFLAGVAMLLGTLSPWLGVIAFGTLIDVAFIRYEERRLATRFGREYERYRGRVRRWL